MATSGRYIRILVRRSPSRQVEPLFFNCTTNTPPTRAVQSSYKVPSNFSRQYSATFAGTCAVFKLRIWINVYEQSLFLLIGEVTLLPPICPLILSELLSVARQPALVYFFNVGKCTNRLRILPYFVWVQHVWPWVCTVHVLECCCVCLCNGI